MIYRLLATQTRAVTIEVEARNLRQAQLSMDEELARIDESDRHVTAGDTDRVRELKVASSDWWIHDE